MNRIRCLLAFSVIPSLAGSVAADTLLVSNVLGDAVLQYDGADGSFLRVLASGSGLSSPHALVLGPDGLLYVGNRGLNSVQRFDPVTGLYVDDFVPPNSGGLSATHGMAFGPDGNLYVCSLGSSEVLRYDGTSGAFIDVFASGNGMEFPYDLAFTAAGTLIVSDTVIDEILEFDAATGQFLGAFASGSPLDGPAGLTFGPDGNVYVVNYFGASICRYSPTGQLIDVFVASGSGGLDGPIDLEFGPDGDLYVTDFLRGPVLRYDGTTGAYVDDFVPALSGGLSSPSFLTFLPDPPAVSEITVFVEGAGTGVNAGGGSFVTGSGSVLSADQPFDGNYGYIGSNGTASFTGDVIGTDDDPLYLSLRWGQPSFSYAFGNLAPREYDIKLHFMEPVLTSPGQRIADIYVEGQLAIPGFDYYVQAGGTFRAGTATITAMVLDGQLDIDFVSLQRLVFVSGITLESRTADFGPVALGTFAERTVTVENSGTGDLTVSSLSTTYPDFSVVSPAAPFVVAPGGSASVVVRFTPASLGSVSGDLEITSDDPDEVLLAIALTGTGEAPPPSEPDINLSPGALDFGDVVVGATSASGTVTITNQGTLALTVTDLSTTNGAFSASGPTTPFVVAPSGVATVDVVYAPTAVGPQSGSLVITSDDPDEATVSVSLGGVGVNAPEVRVNVAGGVYTASSGNVFSADQPFTAGSFGYIGGRTGLFNQPVSGTTDDVLYQSLRGDPTFTYSFDLLPAGNYQVTLHFMEPIWSGPGLRIFDVSAEGVLMLDDYDIFAQAGATYAAVTETFTTAVSDGRLDLQFTGSLRLPIIGAIEVQYVP